MITKISGDIRTALSLGSGGCSQKYRFFSATKKVELPLSTPKVAHRCMETVSMFLSGSVVV